MNTIKLLILVLGIFLFTGCEKKETTTNAEQLEQIQDKGTVEEQMEYLDSIKNMGSEIALLNSLQESKRQEINVFTFKKDSIKNQLSLIESSLSKVNASKIEPGINGVNAKLDELKGQKENLEEQVSLQKQEIALAQKKVELLKEEKIVYDAQKQALWDKGAAPANFKIVDSLLSGINLKINEEKSKLKNLNRTISDIDEQTSIIKEQRASLSNKIRNNYSAKEIFDDFSKEEGERLNGQLSTVNEKLKVLLDQEVELNNQVALRSGEKNYLQNKQNSIDQEKASNLAKTEAGVVAQNKIINETKEAKKKTRMTYALIGITILAAVLALFYILGRKRKQKKLLNK